MPLSARPCGLAAGATACLTRKVLAGILIWASRADVVWSSTAPAEVSVTIVMPMPVVSVTDVLPPAIASSGAVLIHLGSSEWVAVSAGLPMAAAPQSTVVTTAVAAAQAQTRDGALQGGMAVNVTSSRLSTGPSGSAGLDAAGTEPVRVLVEFN